MPDGFTPEAWTYKFSKNSNSETTPVKANDDKFSASLLQNMHKN